MPIALIIDESHFWSNGFVYPFSTLTTTFKAVACRKKSDGKPECKARVLARTANNYIEVQEDKESLLHSYASCNVSKLSDIKQLTPSTPSSSQQHTELLIQTSISQVADLKVQNQELKDAAKISNINTLIQTNTTLANTVTSLTAEISELHHEIELLSAKKPVHIDFQPQIIVKNVESQHNLNLFGNGHEKKGRRLKQSAPKDNLMFIISSIDTAKTEIEKLKLEELGIDDLVKEAARILLTVRDESKEKNLRIEMGWVGASTNGKHQVVFTETVLEAERWAKTKLEEDDLED